MIQHYGVVVDSAVMQRFLDIEALPSPGIRNRARAVFLMLDEGYRERLCAAWSLWQYMAALQRHDTVRTHDAARAIMAELDTLTQEPTDD